MIRAILVPFFLITLSVAARAVDLEEARGLLRAGKYTEVVKAAEESVAQNLPTDEWSILQAQALLATGRYPEALVAIERGLQRLPFSLRLRLLGYEVLRANGQVDRAKALFDELDLLVARREWAYREPADRVAIGRAALIAGVDPKIVLDRFYEPVKKAAPDFRDSYIASGELALTKSDFALAGKMFDQAAKKFADDADVQFGMARAYASGDAEVTSAALTQTLKLNPNHVGARLLLAERAIDSEQYEQAGELIEEALGINPALPEIHALRAVIAHLKADAKTEKLSRDAALKFWPTNPAVDSLIGR